uniref:CPBP family intramembrane glutamic endopeptidase n=1 Tax=Sphingomonas populi TaxID=2484750 RepID=UPI0013EEE493|nr:CPBP family intramembrane glutamic endopeptidase [Sphingomonas populi]
MRSLLWLAALMVVLVAILSLQSIVRSFTSNATVILMMAFVTVVLAYGAYGMLVRWGERRTVSELALTALPAELGLGIAIGVAIMSAVISLLWLVGVYDISAGRWTDWPHDIREALGTGLLEELLARLVIFRLLVSAFSVKPALILSAALFGAAHFFNPAASVSSTIAIAVEAGLTFAGFYLLTGRVWISVGAHAGWNFAQGAIFGARVSGMASDGSLLVSVPRSGAPLWLSGGSFGPEASLVAVAIGLGVFLFTMQLTGASAPAQRGLQRVG